VTGGNTNFILFSEGFKVMDANPLYIPITHFIVPDGDPRRSTDNLLPGTYTGELNLSDLTLANDGALLEAGKLTITGVKVYSCGGAIITINKLALESIATKIPDVSTPSTTSSAPSDTSSKASSSSNTSTPVKTGDGGMFGLVIFAVVALAGATTISSKKRSR